MPLERTPLDDLRAEYVKQIVAAEDSDAIDYLLMEWGTKAYTEGWTHAFDRVRRLLDDYKR